MPGPHGTVGALQPSGFPAGSRLAANLAHVSLRLPKPGLVDKVPRPLGPYRVHEQPGQVVVAGSGAQGAAQVGFFSGEEAIAQFAVGGEPDAVARAAEGLRDGRDDADLTSA